MKRERMIGREVWDIRCPWTVRKVLDISNDPGTKKKKAECQSEVYALATRCAHSQVSNFMNTQLLGKVRAIHAQVCG